MTQHLMADISSAQNPAQTSLRAYADAGFPAIAIKATEGNSYVNPGYAAQADEAHRLGLNVVHYHFATAAVSGTVQVVHFLREITPHLRPGDSVALDVEPQPSTYPQWHAGEAATVAHHFAVYLDQQGPRLGRGTGRLRRRRYHRLQYASPGFAGPQRLTLRPGWHRWVASWGSVPPAGKWSAWQFTDARHIPGLPGSVDCSQIRGPLTTRRPHRPAITYRPLRLGAAGHRVRALQTLLNVRAHADLTVDGRYGPLTARAVNRVKQAHGWRRNGTAGHRVWRTLNAGK